MQPQPPGQLHLGELLRDRVLGPVFLVDVGETGDRIPQAHGPDQNAVEGAGHDLVVRPEPAVAVPGDP